MADWTAPFSMPKFTDDQFAAARTAHIAEHGYTITIPGIEDIIKIGRPGPMTELENQWWKDKDWTRFGPRRLAELREEKEKKRARYLAMLSSPSPDIVRSAGSVMTAVDDAQDAISTLAVMGKIAWKVAPKLLGKVLSGPVGLLTGVSDALNMVQAMGMFCMQPMMSKRVAEKNAKASPKHNRNRVKKAFNIKKWKPNKGDWIQGLQTTEQVFGFGISLGPLMGMAQDLVAGSVRSALGQKVTSDWPPLIPRIYTDPYSKILKALPALFGWKWATDDEDSVLWIVVALLAFQHLFEVAEMWNPLKMMDFSQELEIKALEPVNELTIEVINEGPVAMPGVIGWPQTGTRWAHIDTIAEGTEDIARDNLLGFMERNKHMWRGFVGGTAAVGVAQWSLACMEGPGNTEHEISIQMQAALTLLKHGLRLDPNQPREKFALFNEYLQQCEETQWSPTLKNITDFCDTPWNDVKLVHTTMTIPS